MKITPDTNVLVRAIAGDDVRQSRIAQDALDRAEVIALALPALCEFVWVLSQGYRVDAREIAAIVDRLVDSDNVIVNRAAVEAGLQMLRNGGDFADGAIAYEGNWLSGDVFVSFDRRATKLLAAKGMKVQLLK